MNDNSLPWLLLITNLPGKTKRCACGFGVAEPRASRRLFRSRTLQPDDDALLEHISLVLDSLVLLREFRAQRAARGDQMAILRTTTPPAIAIA
jgi:hypothetical protein